jgi:RNA polymerase-associated protein RTF1
MEKSNGQTFVTDQYVIAAHGKAEREWPFIACSDSAFTEVGRCGPRTLILVI